MRDAKTQKDDKAAARQGGSGASAKAGDPASERLNRASARLGNDEMQRLMQRGDVSRDEMLEHICKRLGVMRDAQHREVEAMGQHEQRNWARKVADSHLEEYTKPDPKRWHEPARLYDEAAFQLCRGALGAGAQLLERAMQAETRVVDETSKVVDLSDLDVERHGAPGVGGEVAAAAQCTPCDEPSGLAVADEILSESKEVDDPPVKRRVRDPWWNEEEDEEEEENERQG